MIETMEMLTTRKVKILRKRRMTMLMTEVVVTV